MLIQLCVESYKGQVSVSEKYFLFIRECLFVILLQSRPHVMCLGKNLTKSSIKYILHMQNSGNM